MVTWSKKARQAWLDEYERTFSRAKACDLTGIGWRTQERWQAEDPEWAEELLSIERKKADVVQAQLLDWALNGLPGEPVIRSHRVVLDEETGKPLMHRRVSEKLILAAAAHLAGWGGDSEAGRQVNRTEVYVMGPDKKPMEFKKLLEGHFAKLPEARTVDVEQPPKKNGRKPA